MRTLLPGEIDVRVSSIKDNGLQLLLYKTARVDMAFLDELYTPFGWSCEYSEIKGNLFCGISVKTEFGWVTKWDCGIESRESGGNEKKGEASDAFKRAGTKWGIGRELYTSPFIWVSSENVTIKKDARGNLTTYDRFSVSSITVENGNIVDLVIKNDNTGNVVYAMNKVKLAESRKKKPPQDPDRPRLLAAQAKLGWDNATVKAELDKRHGSYKDTADYLEGVVAENEIAEACAPDEQAIIDQAARNVRKTFGGDK